MEESVSQVDFDQLQIKNREYVHYLSEGALHVMKRRLSNRSLPASKSRCYVFSDLTLTHLLTACKHDALASPCLCNAGKGRARCIGIVASYLHDTLTRI